MKEWKLFRHFEVNERWEYIEGLRAALDGLSSGATKEAIEVLVPFCMALDDARKLGGRLYGMPDKVVEMAKRCWWYVGEFWGTAPNPTAPFPQPLSPSTTLGARGVDTGENTPTAIRNAASEVTTPLAPLGVIALALSEKERGREKGAVGAGSFHLDDIITRLSPTLRSQAESIEAVYALLNDAHETMSRLTYDWWKGQPGYWKAKEVRILHYKHVHSLVEQTVPSPNLPKGEGERVPFWVLYAKQEEGAPISPADGQVVCISTDKKSGTRRVQFVQSGQIRRLCDSNICRVWLSRDKEWNVVGN